MNNLPFLLNEEELSEWSYEYCKDVNDDPEVRKYITDSRWVYIYCKYINDDPEIRKNIIDSNWAYIYCLSIKNDPEIRKNITDSFCLGDTPRTLVYSETTTIKDVKNIFIDASIKYNYHKNTSNIIIGCVAYFIEIFQFLILTFQGILICIMMLCLFYM